MCPVFEACTSRGEDFAGRKIRGFEAYFTCHHETVKPPKEALTT